MGRLGRGPVRALGLPDCFDARGADAPITAQNGNSVIKRGSGDDAIRKIGNILPWNPPHGNGDRIVYRDLLKNVVRVRDSDQDVIQSVCSVCAPSR